MDTTLVAGLWGLLGSSWFALPKMLSCLVDHPERLAACVAELAIGLLIGAGMAAAFVPSIMLQTDMHQVPHLRALATVVGFGANKAAPIIQGLFGSAVERWARGKVQ